LFGPETEQFTPERFMDEDAEGNGLKQDLSNAELAFGFGRRACPGRREFSCVSTSSTPKQNLILTKLFISRMAVIARDTIWIIAANIAAYDISDPVDASGKHLTAGDHLEYTNSLIWFVLFPQSFYSFLVLRAPFIALCAL